MVLPMGQVESTKFFCDISDNMTDVKNAMVNTEIHVLACDTITKIPATAPPLPLTSHA